MRLTVNTSSAVGYARLREGTVARTVQVTDSLLVDLDGNDRILGVETLSGEDWREALVNLAMTGRLAVPDRQVVTVAF
jgi:uncharacterized protein YuzE